MKFISFIIFGLGIFDVVLSDGFFGLFDYDLLGFNSNDSESSNYGICSFLSELFGFEYDEDESDEGSNGSTDKVQLPGGPSWLETMHPTRPQPPSYHQPQPGHEQEEPQPQPQPQLESESESERPPGSNNEPSPTVNPFYPIQQQQQEQQVQHIFNNSQSIPMLPPMPGIPVTIPGGIPNDTFTPEDTLILSTPDDELDDTDGEGVLVGE